MTKGNIVGNIFFIDVKYMGILYMSKINIARWRFLETSFFVFLMLNLDTLSLKAFLTYTPRSNGRIGYMVGNIIPRHFQLYMTFPLTPYEFFHPTIQPKHLGAL